MHWACRKITEYTEAQLQCIYRQLSPSRKERIDRLRREEDRKRSLAAECLVYELLQKQANTDSAKLHCTSKGQPYLTGCEMHVSISHCDQMVACAISDAPVGIDIERIRPIKLNICKHVCVPEEMEYLAAGAEETWQQLCCDESILRRFFEIWTAKEAYYKKCGTGITDLKAVNILPLQRQLCVVDDYFIQILGE